MSTTIDAHAMKLQALSNYGLTEHSHAMGHFENPNGSTGFFYAPAESCFRCLAVCPGYWSLEALADYAHGNGIVRQGARVWYGMKDGRVKVYESPVIN